MRLGDHLFSFTSVPHFGSTCVSLSGVCLPSRLGISPSNSSGTRPFVLTRMVETPVELLGKDSVLALWGSKRKNWPEI